VPDPTAPENIENVSGRGIFLMKKLSDNTEFFDNGTRVVMTFKL
jgi:serine/threonine-protein kinase RsbW